MYREIIAVCSQIHTEHLNTIWGPNLESLILSLVVHIVTTWLSRFLMLLLMWPGNGLCPSTSHVRYCLHKNRPFVPYLGLSRLTPHPRILCAQLFLFLFAPFVTQAFFSFEYSRALRCTSTRFLRFSPLRRLRAACLNAVAIYGKEKLLWALHSRVSDPKLCNFFVAPMHAIRCTNLILLQFIILMRVE